MGRFLVRRFWGKIESMENDKTNQQANVAKEGNAKNIGIWIIIVLIVAAIIGAVGYIVVSNVMNMSGNNSKTKESDKTPIALDEYDTTKIIAADSNNGNIGDHVRGNVDAKVVVVEYADLQCPSCAVMMSRIDRIYSEYKDRVAFIYRNYPISGHQNAMAASKAAEAAGYQGKYWEMVKYLYANRTEWIPESGSKLMEKFEENFKYAAPDGDLEKFRADMEDENIAKKINFDHELGYKRDGVNATPMFFVNGEKVDINKVETFADYEELIKEMIEDALSKAE